MGEFILSLLGLMIIILEIVMGIVAYFNFKNFEKLNWIKFIKKSILKKIFLLLT